MKILLIFTFCLVSGPVTCSDVIGYSGGSVIIISNIKWYTHDSKYICKVEGNDCSDIIRAETKRHQVQDGRFMLYSNTGKHFLVLIRKLKPQDAGTYRFGLGNQNNSTVNLKVYNSGSCEVPKIMNTYLGQNIAITCNYPGQYEKNYKYFDSVNFDSKINTILDTDTKSQNGRFSISDDKSAKVLSVNISNVTETDEVFYLLGVYNGDGAVRYWSFFAEIQLNIKGSNMMTSSSQTEIQSTVCFSSSAFISVCICAVLLLIGGFALIIYKLRRQKTQGSRTSSRRHPEAFNKAHSDPGNNQADYECLDPETQLTSVYDTIQV
ncbi:polymeric immunoglobulin receptor-like isoform X1 [Silurus meridionalis]|uniref:polymeric immunoglobulin receptor-like isoform X1 n=1 Tax=Silurus meridionalis TaxID=175797 RepID=UPI001EE9B74B|nr:polymeric immunoglobulin receptor-like isoform X1 [Silurus meridionalis]